MLGLCAHKGKAEAKTWIEALIEIEWSAYNCQINKAREDEARGKLKCIIIQFGVSAHSSRLFVNRNRDSCVRPPRGNNRHTLLRAAAEFFRASIAHFFLIKKTSKRSKSHEVDRLAAVGFDQQTVFWGKRERLDHQARGTCSPQSQGLEWVARPDKSTWSPSKVN